MLYEILNENSFISCWYSDDDCERGAYKQEKTNKWTAETEHTQLDIKMIYNTNNNNNNNTNYLHLFFFKARQ